MSRWLKVIGGLLAVGVLALLIFLVPTIWFKPYSINHFYMRVLIEQLTIRPLIETRLKAFRSAGFDILADELPDESPEGRKDAGDLVRRQLELHLSYDRSEMSPTEMLSYDVMTYFLERQVELADKFPLHFYHLNQLSGLQVTIVDTMVNDQVIEDRRDAVRYLDRVEAIRPALKGAIRMAKAQAAEGIVPPNFILKKVRLTAEELTDHALNDHPLRKAFLSKIEGAPFKTSDLEVRLDTLLSQSVVPGFHEFAAEVGKLEAKSNAVAGVHKLPNGKAYYRALIRMNANTDMTPDAIHAVGLREVERIEGQMKAILSQEGLPTATVGATLAELGHAERFKWPEDEASKTKIVERYSKLVTEIQTKLGPMFELEPTAGVEVVRVPDFKESTAPFAYYFPPAMDGSSPGRFYINVRDVKEHAKFRMRTLAYHEAIPGHHFQFAIAREQAELPLFRQLIPFNAFSEGWALYAEQLADEHGLHKDPYDRLGYLAAQLFRAVRLVVDTGIHSKGWTREQAIEYIVQHTGMPTSEATTEVERYVVIPGQALGYMIGRLKILELRARAKKLLGPAFDLRAFHSALLTNGSLPLPILEEVVDQWISDRTSR